MKVGDRAQISRTYSKSDLAFYQDLGGAFCEAHVPPPLIGALFSYILGVKLPGYGTNYLKQEMRFLAKARVGESLTASVTITRVRPHKQLVDLETKCIGDDEGVICTGRALVYVQDVALKT